LNEYHKTTNHLGGRASCSRFIIIVVFIIIIIAITKFIKVVRMILTANAGESQTAASLVALTGIGAAVRGGVTTTAVVATLVLTRSIRFRVIIIVTITG